MAALSTEALAQLSALLYEAAYDEGQWMRACEALRMAFNCQAASLLIKQDDRFDRIHGDCDQYYSDLYWNELTRYDPLQAGPPGNPRCGIYTDQSVLAKADFRKSVMYNEWFVPQQLHGVLLLKLFDPHGGAHTIFTLNRGMGQPDFDAHDVSPLRILEPVFQHAMQIRRHAAMLRLDARESTFEQMGIGHLIVNRQRQVLRLNAVAEQLVAMASAPMRVNRQRLEIPDARSATRLDKQIAAACAHPGADPTQSRDPVGELLLYAERGPSLALSVYPLWDAAGCGLNARHGASVVMREINGGGSQRMKMRLHTLFDFSAREAELAMMLIDGYSLREAADRRHVSITTVRSQLASLFRKTGTTRQGQLIALLARLG